jgi:hypothetical protein
MDEGAVVSTTHAPRGPPPAGLSLQGSRAGPDFGLFTQRGRSMKIARLAAFVTLLGAMLFTGSVGAFIPPPPCTPDNCGACTADGEGYCSAHCSMECGAGMLRCDPYLGNPQLCICQCERP